MKTHSPNKRRCAIYTRKSSEDGLEQDFNSLHAQHEACEAYIRSQAGEGWRTVATRYDDGGYSGGTLQRPALTQLLADVRAGRIETIVVYKVDRLTRSLADFAKIVEAFDSHGVSFVSVTQQFNTTTSMGRLTLNMLLSFAQFEREVTGERIRDKIAASKQKGMWMGGYVPLGYEANGRSLTINEPEADTVRLLFRLYLEHGTVRRVKQEADRLGLTTKMRTGPDGGPRGARPLSRGHIYKLLGNALYAGRIVHKGQSYDGQHAAIIDAQTWDAVQAGLAANTHANGSRSQAQDPSLLAGKLFDDAGEPLTPSHAVKAGRRYRYYVSRRLITDRKQPSDLNAWRLPAREIERIVGAAITGLLNDRLTLTRAARDAGLEAADLPPLLDAVSHWNGQPQAPTLDLAERIDLLPQHIAIRIDLSGLMDSIPLTIQHTIATGMKRRGVEMRLVLASDKNRSVTSQRDATLIKAVARAHRWFDDLSNGRAASLAAIAAAEKVSDRYVAQLLPLAFLAPDIVAAIVSGDQPADLTAETLIKHVDLPLSWADQRTALGFI